MTFCFTSLTTDLVESFWKFEIKEINLQVPFLLVAHAKDPFVVLDVPLINFGAFLIGMLHDLACHFQNVALKLL